MEKKTFKGNETKNARIKIDYQGVKPNVTFSYPDKKHQVEGSMFGAIVMVWFLILGIGAVFISFSQVKTINDLNPFYENYTHTVTYEEQQYYNDLVKNNLSDILSQKILFEEQSTKLSYGLYLFIKHLQDRPPDSKGFFQSLFLIFLIFVPPLLIYFPFRKEWKNVYPRWQAWSASKKYTTLNSKDLREENGQLFVEVPLFNNVLLNYVAKKDFSKYLMYFEIREHKFWKYRRSEKAHRRRMERYHNKLKKGHHPRKPRPRKKINEWLWYARFYFSKRPEKGSIDVTFK